MNWYQLNQEEVMRAAQREFAGKVIEWDTCDLYMKDLESGEIHMQGITQPFFVSTHYVYEERVVKGNNTRYKVSVPLIYVKDNAYDPIYDLKGQTYCVYEENNVYHFISYDAYLDWIIAQRV